VGEVLYTTKSVVRRVSGVHRLATLETGEHVNFGVHGAIKAHYRIDAEDLPLPADYIVAATGA
jgi:hypothetical protein